MTTGSSRKNSVDLKSYNYREDIEHRLFMSDFSVFEVELLREILNHALVFPTQELVSSLHTSLDVLQPALEKFAKGKLLKYAGDKVTVDKELRRYYEVQMDKFDDETAPGFDFLFSSLRRVPIHVLPDWYSVPRTCNDILTSLAETYLHTPKIYEQHLAETVLSDPAAEAIKREVFASPDLKVRGADLRKKYRLSRENFEEILLQLEFHFICCLGYNRCGDQWEEVVTPFREWRDYLHVRRSNAPKAILDTRAIRTHREWEFGFLRDLTALLKAAEQAPLPLTSQDGKYSIALSKVAAWLPDLRKDFHLDVPLYLDSLLRRLLALELAEVHKGQLHITAEAKVWYRKSLQDQGLVLYRFALNQLDLSPELQKCATERALREIERGLKQVIGLGWVYFEDFARALTACVGNAAPVTLKRVGKRWRYDLPQYSEEELSCVRWVVLSRLFEAGMVAVGVHDGKECFCVTSFGRMAFGD